MTQKNDDKTLKMALYTLKQFIREEQFANEFLQRDGLKYLIDIIGSSHGNTLAVRFLYPFPSLTC